MHLQYIVNYKVVSWISIPSKIQGIHVDPESVILFLPELALMIG